MATFVSRFFTGFQVSLRGARYLANQRELWRYAVLPLGISSLVAVALLFALGHVALDLGAAWSAELSASWWGTALKSLLYAALTLAVLGFTSVALFALNACLAPFFQGALADKVERQLGVSEGELPGLSLWNEILDANIQALTLVAANVAVLTLHLIPGVGSVAALGIGVLMNSYWLGREALEFPLALRGWKRPRRHEWAHQNLGYVFGVGASALVLTWIPLLGTAAYCSSVVGSVLFYRDHRRL